MIRDAWLIVGKDLKVELESRVVTGQILPFGLLMLILFGLAISPDLRVVGPAQRSVLQEVAPGLFWLAVLLSALMALTRAFGVEEADGSMDALRMAGLDPAGVFLGKAVTVAIQLLAMELILGVGAVVVFGAEVARPVGLAVVLVLATASISLAGVLYGAIVAGVRSRDMLIPLLVLPVLAPVLLAATLATRDALYADPDVSGGTWTLLLSVFTLLYLGAGMLAFGTLLEES